MSFLGKLCGRASDEYQLPYVPDVEWPGRIAGLLDHQITAGGLSLLARTAVYVDSRNNSVGVCTEDDGTPPDLSDDPVISAYCVVSEAGFFPKAKMLIDSLEDSRLNQSVARREVVDQLAWSIVSMLEQRLGRDSKPRKSA